MKEKLTLHIYFVIFSMMISLVSGCAYIFKNKVPIDTIRYKQSLLPEPETLIVFLPGIFSGPRYFYRKGLVRDLFNQGIAADAVAIDAHSGYYQDKSLFPRILYDVIQPARDHGYKTIWLVGVSLGGLGVLLYAQEHPETIQAVFSIAPYLGTEEIINEIKTAGGLRSWQPKLPLDPNNRYQRTWLWLKEQTKEKGTGPFIYLGFGLEDRFQEAHQLLAAELPVTHVITAHGSHRWRTWRRVFASFLSRNILPRRSLTAPIE